MISSFPDPYSDEGFYSICARFHARMNLPSIGSTYQQMFGTSEVLSSYTSLEHIEYLMEVMPPGHRYTIAGLNTRNTLMPFYSPFLTRRQVYLFYKYLESFNGKKMPKDLSVNVTLVKPLEWFQYCTICVESDREKFGECFWHRLHQLPGVQVCPIHMVFLKKSNVRLRNYGNGSLFELVPAEQAVEISNSPSVDLSNSCHSIRWQIANDALWLLDQQNLFLNLDYLRKRYLSLFKEQGFMKKNDRVNLDKLVAAFQSCYSTASISLFGYALSERNYRKLILQLFHDTKSNSSPVSHLLLIHLLGHTAQTFFGSSEELYPFGKGPWRCLNQASSHFREFCIHECYVDCLKKNDRVRGIFYCSCGFVYSRVGPDISSGDQFRLGKIEEFGSVWESVFEELWHNPEVTVSDISQHLGLSYGVIRSQAERLRVQFSKPKKLVVLPSSEF